MSEPFPDAVLRARVCSLEAERDEAEDRHETERKWMRGRNNELSVRLDELQAQFDSDGVIVTECWEALHEQDKDPNRDTLSVVVKRVIAELVEAKRLLQQGVDQENEWYEDTKVFLAKESKR